MDNIINLIRLIFSLVWFVMFLFWICQPENRDDRVTHIYGCLIMFVLTLGL
jgi:hypothetical protein